MTEMQSHNPEVVDEVAAPMMPVLDDEPPTQQDLQTANSSCSNNGDNKNQTITSSMSKGKFLWLLFISNLFFAIGSGLYYWLAWTDLEWSLQVRDLHAIFLDDIENNNNNSAISSSSFSSSSSLFPYYDLYSWDQLPEPQKEALATLGYDQRQWDTDKEPDTSNVDWVDLTPEQKEAARVIGYRQFTWDESDLPSWSDLTPEQREAAKTLGYSSWWVWEEHQQPEESDWYWDDLTDQQQEAAVVLGYDKITWDGPGTTHWEDLTPEQQISALYLGYNELMWKNEKKPKAIKHLLWGELTKEQRMAAEIVGFNEETWNGSIVASSKAENTSDPDPGRELVEEPEPEPEPESESVEADVDEEEQVGGGDDAAKVLEEEPEPEPEPESIEEAYNAPYKLNWSDLRKEEKDAAQNLGYTYLTWENGTYPETRYLDWEELSDGQKESALLLGYNRAIWDDTVGKIVPIHDGDMFVFHVPSSNTRVSRYMVVYFFAALCFVVVGTLDLFRERHLFHFLMIAAGLMGVVSACLVERNPRTSDIFNAISVHLFFLEAVWIVWNYRHDKQDAADFTAGKENATTTYTDTRWKGRSLDDDLHEAFNRLYYFIIFANVCFAIGSLIEVALSYFYILDVYAVLRVPINVSDLVAQSLWIICSTILLASSVVVACRVYC